MDVHADWLRHIDAELEGELTLVEQTALARHLAACPHCAGARASSLEMRVAMAQAAGEPNAHVVPRPATPRRSVALWAGVALLIGAAVGWGAHERWGGPGGAVEDGRAAIFVR